MKNSLENTAVAIDIRYDDRAKSLLLGLYTQLKAAEERYKEFLNKLWNMERLNKGEETPDEQLQSRREDDEEPILTQLLESSKDDEIQGLIRQLQQLSKKIEQLEEKIGQLEIELEEANVHYQQALANYHQKLVPTSQVVLNNVAKNLGVNPPNNLKITPKAIAIMQAQSKALQQMTPPSSGSSSRAIVEALNNPLSTNDLSEIANLLQYEGSSEKILAALSQSLTSHSLQFISEADYLKQATEQYQQNINSITNKLEASQQKLNNLLEKQAAIRQTLEDKGVSSDNKVSPLRFNM